MSSKSIKTRLFAGAYLSKSHDELHQWMLKLFHAEKNPSLVSILAKGLDEEVWKRHHLMQYGEKLMGKTEMQRFTAWLVKDEE